MSIFDTRDIKGNQRTLSWRRSGKASFFARGARGSEPPTSKRYLSRSGANYFYAMEFVEGETLEHLIKRSGRLADHEHTSAPRLELEHLSNDAGAKLLRALGVKGDEEKLRTVSEEFNGHCLSLTLLGSYLTDA